MQLRTIALANTFGLIDFVLHPFFHGWGWLAPESYERVMRGFVIGLDINVDARDRFGPDFFFYWFLEVATFWILGAAVAVLYNRMARANTMRFVLLISAFIALATSQSAFAQSSKSVVRQLRANGVSVERIDTCRNLSSPSKRPCIGSTAGSCRSTTIAARPPRRRKPAELRRMGRSAGRCRGGSPRRISFAKDA